MEISLVFAPLDEGVHALSGFECGVEVIDDFIGKQLHLYQNNKRIVTYVVINDEKEIVAVFALSFSSIKLDDDSKDDLKFGLGTGNLGVKVEREYEKYFWEESQYPSLNIECLCVRKDCRGKGIGKFVVSEIIKLAKNQKIGGRQFVTANAYYEKGHYSSVGFYDKCKFSSSGIENSDSKQMYYCIL